MNRYVISNFQASFVCHWAKSSMLHLFFPFYINQASICLSSKLLIVGGL